jgi:hypothetical protein
MHRTNVAAALTVLSVLFTIAMNGLANALPFNGLTTAEISDRFQVYFVPAGYVFAIWGLIYIGLLAFAVYQALPAQRANPRLGRVRGLVALSGLANVAWLLLWHYEQFALTVVVMLALLGLLVAIYLRLGIGREPVSRGEHLSVRLPFSLYLGWISVATIANVTSLLDYWRWSGWGLSAVAWAIVMLLVGTLLALAMRLLRADTVFGLVVVWAFAGIAVKQAATPPVAITAWLGAGVVALGLVLAALPPVQQRLHRLSPA